MNRIANVHDKESITIYDVLCSFREGTNIKKNVKLKRSVTSLLASPNMYKEIEELYHNLKSALPPQRKLSLPYNSKWWRNERINELVSRISKIYNIDKNKKPSYRIEHGYLYNGIILYPYAFEILGVPLANPIEDTTKFIGAINYSISPMNIKFEGEYDVDGQYIEGNIDDVLRSCGFHKHSAKKSRLPCIVIGNLITLRRNPHGYDKSLIDTNPFVETITSAVKKMASNIQTFRAAGYIIHQKDDDYRNARQKKINRKVSAKELLRQFLIKERGLPSNG